MKRAAWLSTLVLALAIFGGVVDAGARGWAEDLADELMSPFCPGRTLSACPSPQAKTLVVWLGMQEGAGRSREEVQAELVAQYGEEILPAPPPSGFGLAAYTFPVVAFAAGGAIVWAFLRRQTSSPAPIGRPAEVSASGPIDPELEAIVDRDLSA